MTVEEGFLVKHGIKPADDFMAYHYAYGLYALYMMESMQLAEDIEDGLYFDEEAAAILLENLAKAQATMRYFRRKMKETHAEFDIAETIA